MLLAPVFIPVVAPQYLLNWTRALSFRKQLSIEGIVGKGFALRFFEALLLTRVQSGRTVESEVVSGSVCIVIEAERVGFSPDDLGTNDCEREADNQTSCQY